MSASCANAFDAVVARPRAIGVDHIALEVGDIEEALAFYGNLFTLFIS
ncbi:MAG TPA: hypothetical protein VL356_12800 [Acidocella sp.]|nr:hypothetical protein [Acidocella sp.]